MARGAQVLRPYDGAPFEAWVENASGSLELAAKGISLAEMKSMRVILPFIEASRNEQFGYDFMYMPGAYRQQVGEALTLTMPAPEIVRLQAQFKARQHEATSIDASDGDSGMASPQHERMSA